MKFWQTVGGMSSKQRKTHKMEYIPQHLHLKIDFIVYFIFNPTGNASFDLLYLPAIFIASASFVRSKISMRDTISIALVLTEINNKKLQTIVGNK